MAKKIPGVTFPSDESRRFGLLMDTAAMQEISTEWMREDDAKLRLLCQHYSIQFGPFMFYELALTLARELYPAPKKRGRKSKWAALNQGILVVEVERLAKPGDPLHGVEWACQQLAKREPWKSFLETKESDTTEPDPAESLRKVYYGFRNDKWANVMRKAFKWHEHEATTEEWDNEIADGVRNPHT